jgi:hypothetical protein
VFRVAGDGAMAAALYEAKRQGRDTVRDYQALNEPHALELAG